MTSIRLLAGLAAASLAAPVAANACTLSPVFTLHPDNGVVLLVSGTSDTVAAGPGEIRGSGYGGHIGPRRRGEIYGQVVDVRRVGGPAAAGLAPGRAVVVPWDYDPACEPTAWGRSALWLRSNAQRALAAQLRRREHWVSDLPTFDIVYTEMLQPAPDRQPDEAELLFDYHAQLPSRSQLRRGPWKAVEPARAWLAANPEGARHPLIRWSANGLHQLASSQALRASPAPLAGTWRFEVSRTDGPTHVFHARTALRPRYALATRDTALLVFVPEPAGYNLEVSFQPEPSRLPPTDAKPDEPYGSVGNGDLEIYLPGVAAADGSQRFAGWTEPVNFTGMFEDKDPQLEALASKQLQRFFMDPVRPALAEIVLWPDGRITWTQVMEVSPGQVVTLRGERVSTVAWDGPDDR